jgi:uncharacterized membrane protein YsdA (DUF1294 family)
MPEALTELSPFTVVVMGAAAINVATFLLWGLDKWKAKRGASRISENMLLQFALAGGWPGAWFGAKVFRHKSSKQSFRRELLGVTILNLAVVAGLIWATR